MSNNVVNYNNCIFQHQNSRILHFENKITSFFVKIVNGINIVECKINYGPFCIIQFCYCFITWDQSHFEEFTFDIIIKVLLDICFYIYRLYNFWKMVNLSKSNINVDYFTIRNNNLWSIIWFKIMYKMVNWEYFCENKPLIYFLWHSVGSALPYPWILILD